MQLLKLTALASLLGGMALAGNATGGGGGDTAFHWETAWFPKIGKVRYCYQTAKDFGVTEDEADKAFRAALNGWRDYLQDLGDGALYFDYHRQLACDGAEDITIYLGMETAEVTVAKSFHHQPLGFSHPTKLPYWDVDQWGKGFIWIAKSEFLADSHTGRKMPDWKQPHLLQSIFLHELGHVLGCKHIEGTVMDARHASYILEEKPGLSYARGKHLLDIDGYQKLWFSWKKGSWDGQLGYGDNPRNPTLAKLSRDTFERFFGELPKGPTTAKLEMVPGVEGSVIQPLKLSVTDAGQTRQLQLEISRDGAWGFPAPAFEGLHGMGSNDIFHEGNRIGPSAFLGSVQLPGGKTVQLLFEINMSQSSQVGLYYYWNGKKLGLFTRP
ncbi:hypothetical protein K2X33_02435 [bacterium]|nr:hypothetical protein [bacterium]